MDTKLKAKQDIFGRILQTKIGGASDIPEEKLKESLFEEGAVARCFCFGCGTSTEILTEGAIHLADLAGDDTPFSWNGLYFVSQECIVCGKDYKSVNLKKIP